MNSINYKIYLKLLYFAQIVSSQHWSYELQDNWGEDYYQCFGEKQSPITINTDEVIQEYFPAVEFVGYRNVLEKSYFVNNGHSVKLQLEPDEIKPYIFGGKLNGVYELDSLHFHWGHSNNNGSEHRINQIHYPMEMHFVHRNQKYATLDESMSYPDGIAVVAVLCNAVMDRNPKLNILIDHIMHLKKFNSSISVYLPLVLQSLLPTDINKFFTYEGSLTTPPCSESVTWIVFPETVDISHGQIFIFSLHFFENYNR
ncbi:carbonic anhydrase 2-like isoform X2 [Chrysoperla carnea]|uniref:carbonic anhydrase 2-like isoform X2 n=1 Tax=Chrysoperla carnea TaxID=189513 RepID=UPI001D08E45E|nr:carbonic anhydrase 2-like isoform X2 [Chrysoperla carnea]